MTNHQQSAIEALLDVDQAERQLQQEYAGQARSHLVAGLHQRINRSLKKAEVHATLAVRQELQDLAAVIR